MLHATTYKISYCLCFVLLIWLCWDRNCSKRQSTYSLRRSANPCQPYVDTLYVLPPRRRRPKLVLTGTSIPLYIYRTRTEAGLVDDAL